jgi:hypothetical protein
MSPVGVAVPESRCTVALNVNEAPGELGLVPLVLLRVVAVSSFGASVKLEVTTVPEDMTFVSTLYVATNQSGGLN